MRAAILFRLCLASSTEVVRADPRQVRGASSDPALLAKVNFTTLLQVSPVQMIPSWDHTGPQGLEGFLHLLSSTISGSACLIKARRRESSSLRQPARCWIFASINREAGSWDADSAA